MSYGYVILLKVVPWPLPSCAIFTISFTHIVFPPQTEKSDNASPSPLITNIWSVFKKSSIMENYKEVTKNHP